MHDSLCAVQMIKLLTVEKGKKSRINLIFVAGDRVLKCLNACYEREKKFTQILKYVVPTLSLSLLTVASIPSSHFRPLGFKCKPFVSLSATSFHVFFQTYLFVWLS